MPSKLITTLSALTTTALLPLSLCATTLYWDGTGTGLTDGWTNAAYWSTDANAATPDPSVAPASGDDLVFGISTLATNQTIYTTVTDPTVNSLTFNIGTSTGTTTLLASGGNKQLHIGAGGVTVASSQAGAVTIGSSTAGYNVLIRFDTDQTWTNNSTKTLTIRNSAAVAADAGDVVVTFSGTGTIVNSGFFADNTNATLGIVIDGGGKLQMGTSASNTYSGGTVIKNGTFELLTNTNTTYSYGTGAIQIGDTSGSASATLNIRNSPTLTNNIVSAANGEGSRNLISITAASTLTFTGSLTVNGSLNIDSSVTTAGTAFVFTGGASGAGDINIGGLAANRLINVTFGDGSTAINHTVSGNITVNYGSFTLADNAGYTFYIGANSETNQILGSGSATFAGDFIFDLGSASLADGNSWEVVDMSSLSVSYSSTFSVYNFTETYTDSGIWTNATGLTFTESTGILSYASTVPEPSTVAILGGLGVFAAVALRRRRR